MQDSRGTGPVPCMKMAGVEYSRSRIGYFNWQSPFVDDVISSSEIFPNLSVV